MTRDQILTLIARCQEAYALAQIAHIKARDELDVTRRALTGAQRDLESNNEERVP